MSEPLTRAEIEDVLSSIRRLVSEGSRGTRAPDAPDSGRLILTPAQRVGAPVAAVGAAAAERARAGEALAVVRYAPPRTAADAGEAEPEAAPPRPSRPAPPAAGTGFARSGAEDALSLEQTIAELEAAVAASDGEWEPDGSELARAPAPAGGPPAGPERAASSVRRFGAGGGPGAAARPASPLPVNPPPRPDPDGDPGAERGLLDDDAPDARLLRIDEDTLRSLVAEILREELQGVLGERITRNVRKLVRAEIARALAARPLEP